MQDSQTPTKVSVIWAASAGGGYKRVVPTASQIGIQDGAASWADGFPPLNFIPVASGGVPPFGSDMNGGLNQVSAGVQWLQAGAPLYFDSAFSSVIGGYPKGAVVQSSVTLGLLWISTADNNTGDPDAGAPNWISFFQSISANSAGLFNVQQFTTSTRVALTGNAGNSWTAIAWSGFNYTKKSATSKLIAWLNALTYCAGATAPSGITLTIGGTAFPSVASNNFSGTNTGASTLLNVYSGLGAGALAVSLSYSRSDSVDWTDVFCPTVADNAYLPATNPSVLIIAELGP